MAAIRFFDAHRTWQDWLQIALGVLVFLSPWLTGQHDNHAVAANVGIISALVIGLAALELVDLHRWEEVGQILCGLWVALSPVIVGYNGALGYMHFVLGALIVLLAALELWQDWKLDDTELAKRREWRQARQQ
jgi:hypothetical protein